MDSQNSRNSLQPVKEIESFDFDEWMALAKTDPAAFEERRQAKINELIDSCSSTSRKRLEGIQWQVDTIVQQSNTPLAACLKLSQLMWEKVQGENGLIEKLDQLTGKTALTAHKPTEKADVIQLNR